MSTASTTYPAVIPSPDRLPPEVSSTLSALWLSIGTGLVSLAALWPMALAAAPALFPDIEKNNLANLGWMTFGCLVAAIVVIGLLLTWQVIRKSRSALRVLRLSLLGGMAAGLALVIGIVVVIMQAKGEAPLGPAPIVSGMALFLACLLPFGFGIFALSYAGTDAVEDYFRVKEPVAEESYGGLGAGYGGFAAGAAVAGEEAVVEAAAEEEAAAPAEGAPTMQVGAGDATAETRIQVRGRETMLQSLESQGQETMMQPAVEKKRDTMLMPSGAALDEILEQELTEPKAEATPSAADAQEPLSPEALDAIFSGEAEERVPEVVPGGAEPIMEGSFSDSIFDEEDFNAGPAGASGVSRTDLQREAELLSTGESSIFSEISTLPEGSDVISGMQQKPGDPKTMKPESGEKLPESLPDEEEPSR